MPGESDGAAGLKDKLIEVPQRGLYKLEKRNCIFTVVHGVSQERRELPEGEWYLHTTEAHRVYAACTSSVVPAVWMSQFLRTSLWTNADHKVLVYMRAAEDEPEFS